MKNSKRGFTLIEVIVVMAIIITLAGLVMGVAQKAKERAMVARARAMISALETALSMYQSDIGIYPVTGISSLYTALTSSAGLTTAQAQNWSGPYMQFQVNDISGSGSSAQIMDPWNRAYVYTNPGFSHGSVDYTKYIDLYSVGKDGTASTSDDVTNWQR